MKEDSTYRIDIENGNIDIGGLKSVQSEVNTEDVRLINIKEKGICKIVKSEDSKLQNGKSVVIKKRLSH